MGHTIADVERHLILDTLAYLPRQPDARRTHPGHLDQDPAQQAERIRAGGHSVPEPGQKPTLAA